MVAMAQAVRFTKDGKLLLSAGQDATARVLVGARLHGGRVHCKGTRTAQFLSLNPDEQWLATGFTDGTVRIWSFPEGRCLHTLEKQVTGVFAPVGIALRRSPRRGK